MGNLPGEAPLEILPNPISSPLEDAMKLNGFAALFVAVAMAGGFAPAALAEDTGVIEKPAASTTTTTVEETGVVEKEPDCTTVKEKESSPVHEKTTTTTNCE
jgi:hypothetical protein